jgi:hypothetical protein
MPALSSASVKDIRSTERNCAASLIRHGSSVLSLFRCFCVLSCRFWRRACHCSATNPTICPCITQDINISSLPGFPPFSRKLAGGAVCVVLLSCRRKIPASSNHYTCLVTCPLGPWVFYFTSLIARRCHGQRIAVHSNTGISSLPKPTGAPG